MNFLLLHIVSINYVATLLLIGPWEIHLSYKEKGGRLL